jgi:hypothetical protein
VPPLPPPTPKTEETKPTVTKVENNNNSSSSNSNTATPTTSTTEPVMFSHILRVHSAPPNLEEQRGIGNVATVMNPSALFIPDKSGITKMPTNYNSGNSTLNSSARPFIPGICTLYNSILIFK